MALSPKAKKYLAYIQKTNASLASRDLVRHFKDSMGMASRIMHELYDEGLLEYFEKLDNDNMVRRYFYLSKKPEETKQEKVEKKEVKQVKQVKQEEPTEPTPKYTRLRDVYSEKDYEYNMSLVARSFFDYLDKDLKIPIALHRESKRSKEESKKKKGGSISKTELRRQHVRDMLNTWFPTWAHIQSLPFTHPTSRLRSEKELLLAQQTGVL